MIRKNHVLALFGCSFALASFAAISIADDHLAPAAGKTEAANTAAPASNGSTTATAHVTAWTVTVAPVHKAKAKGVPNFGKLNDHVWRSGQPTKEGYASLKEMGVKTIVNLRKEAPSDKTQLPDGINYVNIEIPDERAPTPEQAQQFLDIVSDSNNWPVLVHCHGGEGRAGVMSALVRYEFDGWDLDKIMKETETFRVAHLGFIKVKMCGAQRDFIKDWQTSHKAGECVAKMAKAAEVASNK